MSPCASARRARFRLDDSEAALLLGYDIIAALGSCSISPAA